MGYNTALFDLDGTLVSTDRKYYITVMNRTFNELNVTIDDESIIDEFWNSMHKKEFCKKHFSVTIEKIWKTLKKYENLDLRKECTIVFDDVNYLERLKSNGYKLGVVTGASRKISDFETALLPVKFDIIINARPTYGITSKPDPHGLFVALRKIESSFTHAFYVGNGTEDVLAAKAAGMLDVFIERGNNTTDVEPSYRIKSLNNLERIIHNTKA